MPRRLGPYVLVEPLGTGAMGAVWRARDERAGTVVALKLLHPTDDDMAERFAREARAAASLRHPNVVSVLDAGVAEGLPFIAYELVGGGDLRRLLRERGVLPWREAARIAADIARALGAIHGARLVHRDLKPENILLDEKGRARVTDFGLVRVDGSTSLTKTGDVLGTPLYISPEQADGRRDIDAAADLYSLGVVLYEVVTGERPFRQEGLALLKAHMFDKPRPSRELAPDIPEALDRLVLALLEKEPRARPDAAAVLEALESLERKKEEPPRRRLGLASALGLLVASCVVVGALVASSKVRPLALPPDPPPPPAKPAPPPPPVVNAPDEPAESEDEQRFLKGRTLDELATDEGMAELDVAIAGHASWFHVRALHADASLRRRKNREALAELGDLVQEAPRSWRLRVLVGRAQWALGEQKDARAGIEEALRVTPDQPELLGYRASYTYYDVVPTGVSPELQDQILADSTRALESIQGEQRTNVLVVRACVRELKNDWIRAADDWRLYIETKPVLSQHLRALGARSWCFLNAGDRTGAERVAEEAIHLDPTSPEGYIVRALAREKDHPELAIADYEKVLELAPAHPDAKKFREKIALLSGSK